MNAETMWQAILARDARADGSFVYAVATGIYCRPSCPARRPRRDNVRLFALPTAAAEAGFRPCRRCRPLEHWAGDADADLVTRLCRFIDDADELPTVAALARHARLDEFRLNRLFRNYLAVTPGAYIEDQRRRRIRRALRSASSVTEATYAAGLGSGRGLYERSGRVLGMTPRQYRDGGASIGISWAFGDTALGLVLLGATDRGLCFLQFGDDREALLAELAAEFPAAQRSQIDPAARAPFEAWMAALDEHLAGRAPKLQVPLDLHGTAFQIRVWNFLQTIPRGQPLSYARAAAALGQPKASRALASACARNRIAVLVPCHRVIRGDGSPGGYRWGLERKRALLQAEAAARKPQAPPAL
ncbi:MAG: bifunctional DNA-binding transcriptional regulator/O6-methylguanine-DNA methyltransferase Ada [Xanthomonadales bacterium]|nr:bifunctional DNA-binding transcriptional regulator/O6-methylguanine-DNA methyltransferase Ada [Xanthomonadales bacterium]